MTFTCYYSSNEYYFAMHRKRTSIVSTQLPNRNTVSELDAKPNHKRRETFSALSKTYSVSVGDLQSKNHTQTDENTGLVKKSNIITGSSKVARLDVANSSAYNDFYSEDIRKDDIIQNQKNEILRQSLEIKSLNDQLSELKIKMILCTNISKECRDFGGDCSDLFPVPLISSSTTAMSTKMSSWMDKVGIVKESKSPIRANGMTRMTDSNPSIQITSKQLVESRVINSQLLITPNQMVSSSSPKDNRHLTLPPTTGVLNLFQKAGCDIVLSGMQVLKNDTVYTIPTMFSSQNSMLAGSFLRNMRTCSNAAFGLRDAIPGHTPLIHSPPSHIPPDKSDDETLIFDNDSNSEADSEDSGFGQSGVDLHGRSETADVGGVKDCVTNVCGTVRGSETQLEHQLSESTELDTTSFPHSCAATTEYSVDILISIYEELELLRSHIMF